MRRLPGAMVATALLFAGLFAPGAFAGAPGVGGSAAVAQRIPGGPAPLTSVPCPSIWIAGIGGSVLATVAPDTAIPASLLSAYGAVRYRGVPAIGLVPFAVPAVRAAAFMATLRALPGVESVALDRIAHADSAKIRTPRDPLLRSQWALARIHATQAWAVETGHSNVVTVAVLDTGVDGTHPDLAGRVGSGYDFYDGGSDTSDLGYHGTAVASVIAADTDNKVGIAGMSWGAQIMPVRVLGPDGTGTECTIAAGIVSAASQSSVENLSLGAVGPCSVAMQRAVDFAVDDSNVALIAAAGNNATKNNPPMEPADCAGAIGVGATDQRDRVASFSEHGPQVTLSAPGVHVLAAYRTKQGGHTYAYFDGTSLAAPMVSGVAALVFAKYPTWSAAQVVNRIKATAIDLGTKGRDDYYGVGRIDAGRALTAR